MADCGNLGRVYGGDGGSGQELNEPSSTRSMMPDPCRAYHPHSLVPQEITDDNVLLTIHPAWKRRLHQLLEQPASSSSSFAVQAEDKMSSLSQRPSPPSTLVPSGKRLLFLGATGYIGSQILFTASHDPDYRALYSTLQEYTIVALVRDHEGDKAKKLRDLWPGIVVIKGGLDDLDVIKEEAGKADIVVNSAVSDHEGAINVYASAILSGLQGQNQGSPGTQPPLYLHVTGLAITSDNCRGEDIPHRRENWASDVGFNYAHWPETNMHWKADRLVLAAGAASDPGRRIRTILAYPGMVYGVGEGVTKECTLYRILARMSKSTGIAGTWGPGCNRYTVVHVKDVGKAICQILAKVFEGTAKVGNEGLCESCRIRSVEIDLTIERIPDFICDDEAEPAVMKEIAKGVGKV
ncbi:hypothetical protein D9611_001116 [Ephemerocybe angulata]|uniref:NAD(P)-binding domain-containing protein n=1 Tax=Ephemerocybe angulata TaxID=980116 RepID=A0A8H5FM62_9AGAR|nr:hypothetical protein D9611_001116 [Tulosesus angulatus]